MPKPLELAGKRFGRLLVICRVKTPTHWKTKNRTHWKCKCTCGKIKIILGTVLVQGKSVSCGCYHREIKTKHGNCINYKPSLTYRSWISMRHRCSKKNLSHRKYYFDKGIKVCKHWQKFENFLADMGERPSSKHTIERKDSTNGYNISNCIWADSFTQNNNKPNNHLLTLDSETLSISQWAKRLNMSYAVISSRILQLHWSTKEALTTPVCGKNGLPRTRKSKIFITWKNKTLSLKQWSKETGIAYKLLHERIKRYKMPAEKALTFCRKKSSISSAMP